MVGGMEAAGACGVLLGNLLLSEGSTGRLFPFSVNFSQAAHPARTFSQGRSACGTPASHPT